MAEWIAYAEVEPFGESFAWLRHGIHTSLLANINRKKGAPPFKAEDFMLKEPGEDGRKQHLHKQSPKEMMAILGPLVESLRTQGKVRSVRRNPDVG